MNFIRQIRRNILFGVVWFIGLFTWDALDSYYSIQRATSRINTDKTTITQLKGAVTDYVIGAGMAYLCMGIMAGIMLHLLIRILHPQRRTFWRWFFHCTALFSVSTILGLARQILTFPSLHYWFPFRRQWAEFAEPWWVDVVWVLAALTVVALGKRAWAGQKGFAIRLGMAIAYGLGVTWVLQPISASKAQDNSGMNVVLIGVDALRPDRLHFNGNDRNTSPNIDALLAESAIFTQAFTQLPRTYPAWITTLTGTWPTEHGIRDNLPTADRLVPSAALLPQVMKDAGYATGFATDDSRFSYMVPETGFSMIRQPVVGLQNFAMSVNEPKFRAFHGLFQNPLGFTFLPVQAFNQSFGSSYRPDQFVEWAVDGLAEMSKNDQFFYAMHSCVLHVPGDRVYPWYHMFGQDGYKGKNRFKYSSSGSSLIVAEVEGAKGKKAVRVAEQDLRIYDSGIRMADDLVGEVVTELKRSGLWDNTIIILFSDHGEEVWAPDLPYKWSGPNHGFHVYGDGHTNVVFSIRFPDGSHAGEVINDPIRLIDLAPTVADMVGLEWPNPVSGKSVIPLVKGQTEDGPRPVYFETGLSEPRYWVPGHRRYPFKSVSKRYKFDKETNQVHIRTKFLPFLIRGKDRAIQLGKWKLVWHSLKSGIRVELYDREVDPLNRIDLAEDYPDKVVELGHALLPFLEVDNVQAPPPEEWVAKSRRHKRKDKRYINRMKRNSGTLPPYTKASEDNPETESTDGTTPDDAPATEPVEDASKDSTD
ncbi:MAG: sulfatase family protein [Myxococcota bacterium]